jgi:aminopeptidase N
MRALPRLLLSIAILILAAGASSARADEVIPWPEGIGPAPSPIRPREAERPRDAARAAEAAEREAAGPGALGTPPDCPHSFDALHYDITLSVDRTLGRIDGTTKILFRSESAGLTQIPLTLMDLSVTSVTRGATPLAFTLANDSLHVTLDAPLALGDSAEISIVYGGDPYNEGFGGFYIITIPPQTDFNLGVGLTANPPSMGRTWFPGFDSPCDKATADFHIKTNLLRTAVCNGELVSVDVDSLTSTRTWNWRESHQIATYLMCVAIARYNVHVDPTYPWIQHYIHNTIDATTVANTFVNVDNMMTAFIDRFGPYPWDKFGYVSTNTGDMEHQTCVFHAYSLINGTTSNDDIVAHELGHQWWGDLVTYADWREIYLSEGFATYCEALSREALYGDANFHAYVTNALFGAYLNNANSLTYPIFDPVNKWGVISYEKGASVLHMLRHVVGDSLFFAGLAAYKNAHYEDVATTEDLRAAMESVYGSPLDWFFQEWVYSGGHPKYEWTWWTQGGPAGTTQVRVRVAQTQVIGPTFTMPIDFEIQTTAGDTVVVGWVDSATEDLVFNIGGGGAVTNVVFDPDDWLLDQHTYDPTGVEPGSGDASAAARVQFSIASSNPARDGAVFALALPDERPVTLELFGAAGRLVRRLASNARYGAGTHELAWDGRDDRGVRVASGVYFARLEAGATIETRRLTLVR